MKVKFLRITFSFILIQECAHVLCKESLAVNYCSPSNACTQLHNGDSKGQNTNSSDNMDKNTRTIEQNLEVPGIYVQQGNANGKTIRQGEGVILYTSDLGPCVAVIVNDEAKKKIHFIHSDSNERSGKGKTSLRDAFMKLNLSKDLYYEIALIGAMDEAGLNAKKEFVQSLLPHGHVKMEMNADGAFVFGLTGEISVSKTKFRKINFEPDPNDPNF